MPKNKFDEIALKEALTIANLVQSHDFIDGVLGLLDSVSSSFTISEYFCSRESDDDAEDLKDESKDVEFVGDTKIASIGGVLHLVIRDGIVGEDDCIFFVIESSGYDSDVFANFVDYMNYVIDDSKPSAWDSGDEEDQDDENDIKIIYQWKKDILPCLTSQQHLEKTLTGIFNALQSHYDYFLMYSDTTVPTGYYEHTDKGVESIFKKFVQDVEKYIVPRMKLS